MRVLITGGCGFAGSHLVEHLLATTNWRLTVLDGLTYAGRVDRLTDMAGYDPDRVQVLWHDLRAPIRGHLDDAIGTVDSVLHLAASTHVDRAIADPRPFVLNNITGALTMLQWARSRDLTHFVQISTDEVYGPAAPGHAHAEWEAQLPSNPYSASKAGVEALAIAWWRTYGIPVVITNTMNLFGERQHPEKFVPKVISLALAGEKIPLHARPQRAGRMEYGYRWEPSSRHWLHARNHADALRWILAETTPAVYAEGADRPDRWHVAGQERNVMELANQIVRVLGTTADFEMIDYHGQRPGHDHRYALNAGKIAAAGWKPPVELDESLARTVGWYQRNLSWLR